MTDVRAYLEAKDLRDSVFLNPSSRGDAARKRCRKTLGLDRQPQAWEVSGFFNRLVDDLWTRLTPDDRALADPARVRDEASTPEPCGSCGFDLCGFGCANPACPEHPKMLAYIDSWQEWR